MRKFKKIFVFFSLFVPVLVLSPRAKAHSIEEINPVFEAVHRDLNQLDIRAKLNLLLTYSLSKGNGPSGVESVNNLQLRRNLRWLLKGVRAYMKSLDKLDTSEVKPNNADRSRYLVLKKILDTLMVYGVERAYPLLDLRRYQRILGSKAKNSNASYLCSKCGDFKNLGKKWWGVSYHNLSICQTFTKLVCEWQLPHGKHVPKKIRYIYYSFPLGSEQRTEYLKKLYWLASSYNNQELARSQSDHLVTAYRAAAGQNSQEKTRSILEGSLSFKIPGHWLMRQLITPGSSVLKDPRMFRIDQKIKSE